DLALRLLVAGGMASALVLVGLAFVYATTGKPNLAGIGAVIGNEAPALSLAIPVLLLLGGLAVRAGIAPFHVAGLQVGLGASPLGAGLVFGLSAVAAATVGIKLAAALVEIPDVYVPYVQVVAALAMVGGGAAALAVRSPRPRLAYLAVSQMGWVAAGVSTHFRSGIGGSLFLLGAFALLGLGLLGSVLGVAAVLGTLRVLYIQSPLEESRRGAAAALPAVTALSTAGAVAFCIVIAAYGVFGYPIMGLADQGAEALGLR